MRYFGYLKYCFQVKEKMSACFQKYVDFKYPQTIDEFNI